MPFPPSDENIPIAEPYGSLGWYSSTLSKKARPGQAEDPFYYKIIKYIAREPVTGGHVLNNIFFLIDFAKKVSGGLDHHLSIIVNIIL